MSKLVYIVGGKCQLLKDILEEKGCEVILGDGKCDESVLARCDALMPGMPSCVNVTEELLRKAPNLKIVGKTGAGVNTIDIPACDQRGIYVTNTPDGNYIAVAEHTIMLMLAISRKLCYVSRAMFSEHPDTSIRTKLSLDELCGKTLVLVGLGRIGRRTAHLAAGFGMKLIGVVRHPIDPALLPEGLVQVNSLAEALPQADYVSMHLAGNADTRGLMDAKMFRLMKPTAYFINTARGIVVNEQDMIDALKNGVIAGAALDVTVHEPVEDGNPLLTMDNVIVTPHHAVETPESLKRMQIQCAENIIEALEGRRPPNAVNGRH